MIKVYQIQLTDAEIAIVNSSEGEYTPRIKAYFSRHFETTFNADNFRYYTHVADVDVDGFEQAFEAMNLWQESTYFDRVQPQGPCSSMSVGDIVEDHDGKLYRCASFGFAAL
jgi:hypothetical protein